MAKQKLIGKMVHIEFEDHTMEGRGPKNGLALLCAAGWVKRITRKQIVLVQCDVFNVTPEDKVKNQELFRILITDIKAIRTYSFDTDADNIPWLQ